MIDCYTWFLVKLILPIPAPSSQLLLLHTCRTMNIIVNGSVVLGLDDGSKLVSVLEIFLCSWEPSIAGVICVGAGPWVNATSKSYIVNEKEFDADWPF